MPGERARGAPHGAISARSHHQLRRLVDQPVEFRFVFEHVNQLVTRALELRAQVVRCHTLARTPAVEKRDLHD
jgi:hypothetical protein